LLVNDGYLLTRSRSGHYVNPETLKGRVPQVPVTSAPGRQSSVHWAQRFQVALSAQRNIVKRKDWQNYPYPFIYGQFDPSLMPIAGWRECCNQAMSVSEVRGWAADLIDGDDPLLLEQIQARLLARRGVWATPDEILVTVGAQHALFLLATLLVGADTAVGVENPGYPDARNIFAARGAEVVGLALDDAGLALSPALERCQYVYLTPSHQCPTTITMPLARRHALLNWAEQHDRVLIEDDYEIEIGHTGSAQPALKSLDHSGRVIYVSSLSKTLAPGIRMGYIVASKELIHEARALRRLMLRHPPANNERSVGLFLAMGYHDTLLRRLDQTYVERTRVAVDALERHLPEVARMRCAGGSSLWLRFPEGVDTRALAAAAEAEGVLIEPGDIFFIDPAPANFVRLGFSSIPADRIVGGIERIAAVAHTVARHP
jgi:GntR family transcriptional regulator/MocR family aminotransferase